MTYTKQINHKILENQGREGNIAWGCTLETEVIVLNCLDIDGSKYHSDVTTDTSKNEMQAPEFMINELSH